MCGGRAWGFSSVSSWSSAGGCRGWRGALRVGCRGGGWGCACPPCAPGADCPSAAVADGGTPAGGGGSPAVGCRGGAVAGDGAPPAVGRRAQSADSASIPMKRCRAAEMVGSATSSRRRLTTWSAACRTASACAAESACARAGSASSSAVMRPSAATSIRTPVDAAAPRTSSIAFCTRRAVRAISSNRPAADADTLDLTSRLTIHGGRCRAPRGGIGGFRTGFRGSGSRRSSAAPWGRARR